MNIYICEKLTLLELERYLRMMSKPNGILKLSLDGELHDISKIVYKNDMVIFETEERG